MKIRLFNNELHQVVKALSLQVTDMQHRLARMEFEANNKPRFKDRDLVTIMGFKDDLFEVIGQAELIEHSYHDACGIICVSYPKFEYYYHVRIGAEMAKFPESKLIKTKGQ